MNAFWKRWWQTCLIWVLNRYCRPNDEDVLRLIGDDNRGGYFPRLCRVRYWWLWADELKRPQLVFESVPYSREHESGSHD